MIIGDIYCYWDCQNYVSTGIVCFNVLVTLILLLYSIKFYRRAKLLLKPGIEKFYIALIIWGIFFLTKDIFSITIFFTQYQDLVGEKQKQQQHYFSGEITKFSVIYFILDTIPPVTIQTLLFLIPYHMVSKIREIIRSYGYPLSSNQQKWFKVFTFYKYLRGIISIPLLLALVFYLANHKLLKRIEQMTTITVSMICFDCCVCTVVLIFSYRYLIKKYEILTIDNQKDKKSLLLQSILLILASLFRFLFDAIFFVYPALKKPSAQDIAKMACIRSFKDNIEQYTIGYIMFGTYLMHFFPVVVCLYMYRPIQQKQNSQRKTALITSQN